MTSPPANQKRVHQLTTHPTTPLPHPVFNSLSQKALGGFGPFKHKLPWTPCLAPATKAVPQPRVSRLALLHTGEWTRVWFRSNTTEGYWSLSRTRSSNLLKGSCPHTNVTRLREEDGPQVNYSNTLNSDVRNLREAKNHCRQRADGGSPRTRGPDPCRWGETPSPQTLHLGSHIHTCQVTPPPQTLHLGSHVHTRQVTPPPQTLHLGSHVHTRQVTPPPQTLNLGSHVHTRQVTPPPHTLHLGSHVPLVRTPRPCWLAP